ncbi:MAG: cadherin-like beta sandwich domain-containing protein [Terracidiphilus sp.]|nr:cadherin-like beta sandwich domain-containing protein [Terracidiphilus sp.]MDR3797282.1 cadherin-like beta sandwich domain-containing protein [Terracidiphilus sp.]
MNKTVGRVIAITVVLAASFLASNRMSAQTPSGLTACWSSNVQPPTNGPVLCLPGQVLNAQFTNTVANPITIDGTGSEAAWATATAVPLTIKVTSAANATLPACGGNPATVATVKALWDGAYLYLLFQVADPKVTSGTSQAGVWLDVYNDKMEKYMDGMGLEDLTYSSAAGSTGTFGGSQVYLDRGTSAAVVQHYLKVVSGGYNAEFAIATGGLGIPAGGLEVTNGTQIGMDFYVSLASDTTSPYNYAACKVYWANGSNPGTNDASHWGTVVLGGWNGSDPMAVSTFMLQNDVTMMNAIAAESAQWTPSTFAVLTSALNNANAVLGEGAAATETQVSTAVQQLNAAMLGLRRAGPCPSCSPTGTNNTPPPYPDPFDLPNVYNLNDPFQFFNGNRVNTVSDWNNRAAELKGLAEYYEFGYAYSHTPSVTGTATYSAPGSTAKSYTIAVTATDPAAAHSGAWNVTLTVPGNTTPNPAGVIGKYPLIVSIGGSNTTWTGGGYAVLAVTYTNFGEDSTGYTHTGQYYTMYPYSVVAGNDTSGTTVWAWGASRSLDALQNLVANNPNFAALLDLNKVAVTGVSRLGKASFVAGLLDSRFGLTVPSVAGSGGATSYRYDSFGANPCRTYPRGNVYPWGQATGAEEMGDHIWHNAWNSNEMFQRFLDEWYPYPLGQSNTNAPAAPGMPMVGSRMFNFACPAHGTGNRMPFDHSTLVAAIAPRAVLIDSSNNDYADNPEGDSIGFTGAQPVYHFLGADQFLAYDNAYTNSGHAQTTQQLKDMVTFANMVFYNIPLSSTPTGQFMLTGTPAPVGAVFTGGGVYVNDYLNLGIFNTYYGGLNSMEPWLDDVPHAYYLTNLTTSAGTLNPAFNELTKSYTLNLLSNVTSITLTPTAEDTRATITVNGVPTASGQASAPVPLTVGVTNIPVVVTAVDGSTQAYNVVVSVVQPPPVSFITSSSLSGSNSGGYILVITVQNTSSTTASNLTLNTATLGTTAGATLPQTWGDLAGGATATFTVTFPGSVGLDGARVAEKFSGAGGGFTYSTSLRSVTLP